MRTHLLSLLLATSATAALAVSQEAPAQADPLVSPEFTELAAGATPRFGAAAEEEEGAMPRLAGKRAQAHDVELDIDISEEADATKEAAAPTLIRRPHLGASRAPRPPAPDGAGSSGARLSLKDYKQRLDQAS